MKISAVIFCVAMGLAGTAHAGVIAEKAVTKNGSTVRLQLMDEKVQGALAKVVKCEFGDMLGRLSAEVAGAPQSNQLMALGCWTVNRSGSIEFSAVDSTTGKFMHIRTEADEYRTTAIFSSWGDYMGEFMLSGGSK